VKTIDYAAHLARKLAKMFPDPAARAAVSDELSKYGAEQHEQGSDRVRLAILKLAGTSPEQLRYWVDIAKRDFRDVLAAAEYPDELRAPTWRMPAAEAGDIRKRDAEQYWKWLEE
jgi:hypothetical protein